jgi:hypothetical protein
MEQLFVHSPMGSGMFRTEAQILEFVQGLEIVSPGYRKEPKLELCDQ